MGYLGRVRLTQKKSNWITSQPIFILGKKNQIRIGYFLNRVGFGQKILTVFSCLVECGKGYFKLCSSGFVLYGLVEQSFQTTP